METKNRVAILDAGGQYVDLVKKAVQRQGIPADVLPLNTKRAKIEGNYGAVIISGSPASSHEQTAPQPDNNIWSSDLPILGICYGMQAMVIAHGGKVAKNAIREDGRVTTVVDISHPLFKGTKKDFTALFTHGDFVKSLPEHFETIGKHELSNGSIAYSAISHGNKIGVQFHPEVFDDTPEGYSVFKNFMEIAKLQPDDKFHERQLKNIIETKQQQIIDQSKGRHIIAFVSGGVDSSVAIALASKAIQKKYLHAYFIDNGFMRDEDEKIIEALHDAGIPVQKIDATLDFEKSTIEIDGETKGPLVEVTDPEIKRKIIGKAFIDVQNRIIMNLKLEEAMLLQGTNAADRIESGHSKGDAHTMTIKTHHNQVKEVRELEAAGLLIEPIDDLFKDEVRELGRALKLPEELVARQPFPGPGLAIRIIAANETLPKLKSQKEEKDIQAFIKKNLKGAKGYLLPIKSVGVGGDERSHLSAVAIERGNFSHEQLAKIGTDIPAHFRGSVNRVIYALNSRKLNNPAQTKTLLTKDVRSQLKIADRIVFEEMREFKLLNKITQFPVVILPLSFSTPGQRSIVLRPVLTRTFMTVQSMLPGRDLPEEFFDKISERILSEDKGISQVFLDLTNKPPATIEWE